MAAQPMKYYAALIMPDVSIEARIDLFVACSILRIVYSTSSMAAELIPPD
jgi:hypothetical protein